MDVNSLRTGEKIAGVAGILLLIFMFLNWWSTPSIDVPSGALDAAKSLGVDVSGTDGVGVNAWQAASFLDIIWFLTAVSGILLAGLALQRTQVNLPVALSAIVAGLGALSVLTIIIRLISTPYDLDRSYGVFIGLLAAIGVAYGGFVAMQEEGTSFSDQRDRLQNDRNNPPPAA